MSLLCTRDLVVGHGGRGLLPAVSLDVEPGQLWAIVGPNGAGKSSFLNTVLGLLPPVRGQVIFDPATRPSYVPQQGALDAIFPVRVLEFVLMGLQGPKRLVGPIPAAGVGVARKALEDVGAIGFADRLLRDLSGGQRQRVLIARAIASGANLHFLDEPTNALDIKAERTVLDLIERLRTKEAAVVMVTHLVEEAIRRADRALLLDRDNGVAVTALCPDMRRVPEFQHIYGTRVPEDDLHTRGRHGGTAP